MPFNCVTRGLRDQFDLVSYHNLHKKDAASSCDISSLSFQFASSRALTSESLHFDGRGVPHEAPRHDDLGRQHASNTLRYSFPEMFETLSLDSGRRSSPHHEPGQVIEGGRIWNAWVRAGVRLSSGGDFV